MIRAALILGVMSGNLFKCSFERNALKSWSFKVWPQALVGKPEVVVPDSGSGLASLTDKMLGLDAPHMFPVCHCGSVVALKPFPELGKRSLRNRLKAVFQTPFRKRSVGQH
jgi:ABC-type glutathione transport system ATPase component